MISLHHQHTRSQLCGQFNEERRANFASFRHYTRRRTTGVFTLDASEAFYTSLAQSTPDFIMQHTPDGQVQYPHFFLSESSNPLPHLVRQ
jgi:hypothetical protein